MLSLSGIIKGLLVVLVLELLIFAGYVMYVHTPALQHFFEQSKEPQIEISRVESPVLEPSIVEPSVEALEIIEKELEENISSQSITESNASELKEPKVQKNMIQKTVIKKTGLDAVLVYVEPNSQEDIIPIMGQAVKPVIYTKSIALGELSLEKKKESFMNMIIPAILIAKHRITEDRKRVKGLIEEANLSKEELLWLSKKRHFFKSQSNDELYDKMALHPTSIVMAQAIIESGWGTSRFFEEANNLFGIWSFQEHEKRIIASETRGEQKVYLKKYDTIEQSIQDYFLMLSTKDPYQEFQETRLSTQDPLELIQGLGRYSELGDAYIEKLKNTIEKNKLLAYDDYYLELLDL